MWLPIHRHGLVENVFDGTTTPFGDAFTICIFRSGFALPRPDIGELDAHILAVDPHRSKPARQDTPLHLTSPHTECRRFREEHGQDRLCLCR